MVNMKDLRKGKAYARPSRSNHRRKRKRISFLAPKSQRPKARKLDLKAEFKAFYKIYPKMCRAEKDYHFCQLTRGHTGKHECISGKTKW